MTESRPTLRSALYALVIEGRIPPRPRALRSAAYAFRVLALAAMRFHRDRGQDRASSLAYSTLLALIPFILLGVSLLEFVAPDTQTDVTQWMLNLVFPEEAQEVRDGVSRYLEESRSAFHAPEGTGVGVRVFSGVLLIWFAASLMTGIDRMVSAIWGTGSFRAMVRRLSAYWAVLTLGPVLLALSFAGTLLAREMLGEGVGGVLSGALPFVVTWFSVWAFYRLMPHTGASGQAALAGAAVAGTLWEATKLLMGWYLATPKTLLTALSFFPAALLWMYVSWAIGIYGLEVTYVVHHGAWRAGRRAGRAVLTGQARDVLLLALSIEVARDFDRGRYPDRSDLAQRLNVSEDDATKALLALVLGGVLVAHDRGGFRPARGAGGITALEVVDASRGGEDLRDVGGNGPGAVVARSFLTDLDRTGRTPLAEVTLADLARKASEVQA